MNDNFLHQLNERKRMLENWLKDARKVQDYIPYVQHSLDVTNWDIDTIRQLPVNIESMSCCHNMSQNIDTENTFVFSNLPTINIPTTRYADMSTSMIVCGTPAILGAVKTVVDSSDVISHDFYDERAKAYREIQEKIDLINKVSELIKVFESDYLVDVYNKITKSFYGVKAGTISISTASMDIRTFLDKFKGELFDYVRNKFNKKIKNWIDMCNALQIEGIIQHVLLKQQSERQEIITILSDLGKERKESSNEAFEQIWSRILDHIFITISTVLENAA